MRRTGYLLVSARCERPLFRQRRTRRSRVASCVIGDIFVQHREPQALVQVGGVAVVGDLGEGFSDMWVSAFNGVHGPDGLVPVCSFTPFRSSSVVVSVLVSFAGVHGGSSVVVAAAAEHVRGLTDPP